MRRHRSVLCVGLLLTAAAVAHGQSVPVTARFSFVIEPHPMSAGQSLSANSIGYVPGQQLPLDVYLTQTVPGGTTGSPTGNVLADEHGLFGGGTRLAFGSGGALSVAGNSAIVPNPQFNDAGATSRNFSTGSYAEFRAASDLSQAALPDAANSNRVLLGTFYLDTAAGGGFTSVTASVPSSYTNANVTFDNILAIPYSQTNPATYSLVPVPEPGWLLGLAAAGLLVGHARRRAERSCSSRSADTRGKARPA